MGQLPNNDIPHATSRLNEKQEEEEVETGMRIVVYKNQKPQPANPEEVLTIPGFNLAAILLNRGDDTIDVDIHNDEIITEVAVSGEGVPGYKEGAWDVFEALLRTDLGVWIEHVVETAFKLGVKTEQSRLQDVLFPPEA